MGFCCVSGCSNSHKCGERHFYRIPKVITNQCSKTRSLSEQRRALWIRRINRKNLNAEWSRVCDVHFLSGQPSHLYDERNVDWAPSLLLKKEKEKVNKRNTGKKTKRKIKKKKVVKEKSTNVEVEEQGCMASEDTEYLVVEPTLPDILIKSEPCEMEEYDNPESTFTMTCEPNIDAVLQNCVDVNEVSCQTILSGNYIEKIQRENLIMKHEWETLKSDSNMLVVRMW